MNILIIFALIFVSVLILVFSIASMISAKIEVSRNIRQERTYSYLANIENVVVGKHQYASHYFDVLNHFSPDSIPFKLIKAGYFERKALRIFKIQRILVMFSTGFLILYLGTRVFLLPITASLLLSAISGAAAYILFGAALDWKIKAQHVKLKRIFPDFLDLLIICLDAGLSIDAALDRVARELIHINTVFGTHLDIMMLEIRAGRSMKDALRGLAERIDLDEARTLAVIFKQAEELGSSISKALRVFSADMRKKRMILAEEKANALPVKMLMPMALFLFPTNLMIVLSPVIIAVVEMFKKMTLN